MSKEVIGEWFELLEDSVTIVFISQEVDFPRDRKDAKFIACALSADAEWLITGDKDFVEAEKIMTTNLLTVTMFKRAVMESWGD